MITAVAATIPCATIPAWALLQRALFDALAASVDPYLTKYTLPDGSLRWGGTGAQHGRDDKDDFYEAFYNWPLLYLLGGDARLLALSHRHWNAVTAQLTRLGLVSDEFDVGADFFHQGEGLTYFYFLCLADPANPRLAERARRFADLYVDPAAGNYDAANTIVLAPHTGSKGALAGYKDGDPAPTWPDDMVVYGLPFDDVPSVPDFAALKRPEAARAIGEAMNDRFGSGDVISNLAITSLTTNAYLMGGGEHYRQWTLEYVAAWQARAVANGGIVPDNVGVNGVVGDRLAGRWYGGLYGWSWPHGFYNIAQSVTIAGMNAALLSASDDPLDLARAQFDAVLAQASVRDVRDMTMSLRHHWLPHLSFESDEALRVAPQPVETLVAPYRYGVQGWFDEQPVLPTVAVTIYMATLDKRDHARLATLRAGDRADWNRVDPGRTKEDAGHEAAWLGFLRGENPGFPEAMLNAAIANVERRVAQIVTDETDLTQVTEAEVHTLVHHWQKLNPVTTEALVLLTLGGPQHLYNGGLLFGRVRYFDAIECRPGLPQDVAALVSEVSADRTVAELVNISATTARSVIIQAGVFAEHGFGHVDFDTRIGDYPGAIGSYRAPDFTTTQASADVDGTHLRVDLPPGHRIRLSLETRRGVNAPTYAHSDVAAFQANAVSG